MMMSLIKIIYDYEMKKLTNRRIIIILFTLISVVMSLFVLISVNRILIRGNIEGNFQYDDLLFLYEVMWNILFFISTIVISFFSATSINSDSDNYTLKNIIATRCNISNIILGKLFCYYTIDIAIVLLCVPIIMITTFFGGISYFKMIFIFILLLLYNFFYLSFSLMLSCYILIENISLFVSLFSGVIFTIFIVFYKNSIINNIIYYLIFLLIFFIFGLFFIVISRFSKIYYK